VGKFTQICAGLRPERRRLKIRFRPDLGDGGQAGLKVQDAAQVGDQVGVARKNQRFA
jgi:hypothetical protein